MAFILKSVVASLREQLLVFAILAAAALVSPLPAFAQNAVNTATITPPAGITDLDAANNTATDSDAVVAPQLTLVKSASPSSFTVGVAGSYTLTVGNAGTATTIAAAIVTDTINAALTIGTLPAGCTAAGQIVTCTIAAGLGVGAANAVSFVIPVTPQAGLGGTSVANSATVRGGGDATCPATGAVDARCAPTISTPVNSAASVSVTKTGPATVTAGASYAYTLTVTNAGQTATGTNVIVQDQLPAGVIATAVSGATCTPTSIPPASCWSAPCLARLPRMATPWSR